jgi:TonB-like protein
MRTLIRWAARLYPATWRDRYAAEFDALLDDISPSLGDLFDVVADVLRVHMTTSMDACLEAVPVSAMTLRLPVVVSLSAHGLMIILVLFAVWGHVTTMPLHVVAPLPPPAPEKLPQVTDARVFPNALTLYSSLPLKIPSQGGTLPLYVADGVGINFLSLPDIGATYRQGSTEWRVWPGQAVESFIVRRVLPEYPRGTNAGGVVSVFLEYLITRDGSVRVLRTSGPPPFAGAARSAIERWVYQPLEYENRSCEVVSRVEVRFDSEFAR